MTPQTADLILAAIASLSSAFAILLSAIAKHQLTKAQLVEPLIQSIEDCGSSTVKSRVTRLSRERGVEAAMSRQVKKITENKI